MKNTPIFIVGANRSGTTLLRLILNAHPRIAIPDELNYFSPWLVDHWREESPTRDDFRGLVHWCFEHAMHPNAFGDMDLRILEDEIVEKATTFNWRSVYELALESWAQHHGKARWGEKTPGNLFYVDAIRLMFPDAQFLHLVRDPRGGVESMRRAPFFGEDVTINALNRRAYLREGLRRDASMPPDQWMRVRYEDLLTAPEDTIRSLCDFLKESFAPSMLTYYEGAEQYMSTAASQDFNQAARRPIDSAKVSAWRNHLTPRETVLVEAVCLREMSALGYVPDGSAPSLYDQATIFLKSIYWNLSRRRCDSPEYVVVDSPASHLRRIASRLWSGVSRLWSPSSVSSSDST